MTQEVATNLDSGIVTNTSSPNTNSITPAIGQVLFLAVSSQIAGGSAGNIPTPSLAGWTFKQIATVTYGAFSNQNERLTVFTATGKGAGAINIDFAGQSQQVVGWSVDEISNTVSSGTGGSDCVRNGTITGGHTNQMNITLPAFANVNNGCYAVTAKDATNTISPVAPLVKLCEQDHSGPSWGHGSMFSPTNDTNPQAAFLGSGGDDVGSFACEVVFQGSGFPQVI